jgi:hypothetical protein
VDLVDEQHVVGLEVGEQRGQVAGALQHRAGGLAQVDAHLGGDDVGQGGLAQARRAEQQHVVEGLAALPGRLDEDLQLVADLLLAHVIGQALGAQRPLQRLFLVAGALGGSGGRWVGLAALDGIGLDHAWPRRPRRGRGSTGGPSSREQAWPRARKVGPRNSR